MEPEEQVEVPFEPRGTKGEAAARNGRARAAKVAANIVGEERCRYRGRVRGRSKYC